MSTADEVDLEALLDGVWQRRRVELLGRVGALSAHLQRADAGDADAWQAVGDEAHRLTGALGSLGFDELALSARELERAVAATAQPDAQERAAAQGAADRMYDALCAAGARPRG